MKVMRNNLSLDIFYVWIQQNPLRKRDESTTTSMLNLKGMERKGISGLYIDSLKHLPGKNAYLVLLCPLSFILLVKLVLVEIYHLS